MLTTWLTAKKCVVYVTLLCYAIAVGEMAWRGRWDAPALLAVGLSVGASAWAHVWSDVVVASNGKPQSSPVVPRGDVH